jgi:hypothetical protein
VGESPDPDSQTVRLAVFPGYYEIALPVGGYGWKYLITLKYLVYTHLIDPGKNRGVFIGNPHAV